MTELTRISNSEIQTYKRCKRKWWLTYYRRLVLRRDSPTGPRAIGNRVHACLATYYAGGDGSVANAWALHDAGVEDDLLRNPEQADGIRRDADLTRIMLEGYFEWLEDTGADAGVEVIAPETVVDVEVTTPVTSTMVTIGGKLDLRYRDHGPNDEPEERFLDHKTVGDFTTPIRILHMDEQMLLYRWLLWRITGHFVPAAEYNMLRKVKRSVQAKPPFFMRFTIRHSEYELKAFEIRLLGELEDMIETRRRLDAGESPLAVAYPTPTRDCHWQCDFYSVCPFVDRPQDDGGQYLLDSLFEEGDPYARYQDAASNVIG